MKSIVKFYLTSSYFLVFIYIVFFATRRHHLLQRIVNLVPLKRTIADFKNIDYNQSRQVVSFYSNFLGNIFLYMPFAIAVIWLLHATETKRILYYAFFTSLFTELIQFTLKIGVADVDDILLNVLGAYLGTLVYKVYSKHFSVTLHHTKSNATA